jgi:hypothetical protein
MLCSTNDNSTVNLYESTRSNNLVFTWRPHARKFSVNVRFHTCTICFCTLQNYEYTVHKNCCAFFWKTVMHFSEYPAALHNTVKTQKQDLITWITRVCLESWEASTFSEMNNSFLCGNEATIIEFKESNNLSSKFISVPMIYIWFCNEW